MAYKDLKKAKETRRKYRLANKEKINKYIADYAKTPYGRFMHQRKEAIHERNIEWELTFEEWWKLWQDSGHWEERGSLGFHMCRFGDEGPYSIDNVYIAHHTQNKKDQWANGHTSSPPNRWKNK